MVAIYPVLLVGGSGTRLWPLSRKTYPKQFSSLIGNKTLLQMSALRTTSSNDFEFLSPIILTNSDFRFIVLEQLQDIEIEPGQIVIEPEAKNTAAAILAASLMANKKDPNAVLLVTPTDHIIQDKKAFHNSIKIGLKQLEHGKIVTFGISPTYPETGYGYLEIEPKHIHLRQTSNVKCFIEKPERVLAENMLEEKKYLWNAGIFLFKAANMIDAFKVFNQKTLSLVHQSVETGEDDIGFFRLNNETWKSLESISIDYAIMEKAENLVAVQLKSKWSDLGSWDTVWSELEKDEWGVATSKHAYSIDCTNTLLRSENPGQKIVGLGLNEIVAIAMPDAVLVTKKNRAQDVKKVVQTLRDNKVPQADTFPKDHRPWGWFESLTLGEKFQVKRICVKPNAALSLQSHKFRSEHWIVVEGTAKVTINKQIKKLTEGQSIYVPVGSIHRLENVGEIPMVLIEVQTGSYLGEDDIVRYEDLYSRK